MLDALPVEIVVEILTYLTAQDILRCQLISKRWCDLIEASLQLQYKIQAAAHGYEYREVTPNLSVGDYIAALHRMENLWTRCSLNDHNEPRASPVVVEVKHRGWLSAGQRILGRTIISRVISDHMNVQQNHSSREAIYVSSLESLKNLNPYRIPPEKDFDIVYDCDPLQDLMVTLEHPYGGNSSDDNILRAHTLSLCTGNFHPETSLHSISLDHCNWPAEDYDFRQVTISGSFVIVRWSKYSVHQRHTLDVQHAKIVLYHWPSGVTHMAWNCSDSVYYLFVKVVADRYLLVTRCQMQPTHGLYMDVHEMRSGPNEHARDPVLLATFQLPSLSDAALQDIVRRRRGPDIFELRSDTRLVSRKDGSPVDITALDALLSLQLSTPLTSMYRLHTPLSTFLPKEVMLQSLRSESEPAFYQWYKWGPSRTRMFTESSRRAPAAMFAHNRHRSDYYICGYRVILRNSRVYSDFNPYSVKKYLHDKPAAERIGATVVNSKSRLFQRDMFADEVVTCMPYVTFPLPANDVETPGKMYFMDATGLKLLLMHNDGQFVSHMEIRSL